MAEGEPLEVQKPAATPPDASSARAEAKRVALTKHERKRQELENDTLAAEVESLRLRNRLVEQEVSRLWWDKYTRLLACAAIFAIVVGWLVVIAVLLLQADSNRSDAVFVAALGTTTVNVLGLLYIVARYLFPIPTRANPDVPPTPEQIRS